MGKRVRLWGRRVAQCDTQAQGEAWGGRVRNTASESKRERESEWGGYKAGAVCGLRKL